jgi:hypothetical protein
MLAVAFLGKSCQLAWSQSNRRSLMQSVEASVKPSEQQGKLACGKTESDNLPRKQAETDAKVLIQF